jgi:hypothetical protein
MSLARSIFRGAGVSSAFLQRAEIRKIAGETPAPRKARVHCRLAGMRSTVRDCREEKGLLADFR